MLRAVLFGFLEKMEGNGSFCSREPPGGVRIVVVSASKYLVCILDPAQIDWRRMFRSRMILLSHYYVCAEMS